MRRVLAVVLVWGGLLLANAPQAAVAQPSWEGLVLVPSTQLDQVYLQPGADFDRYTKVMIEPTEVAFAKNWRDDFNNSALGTARISENDLQTMISEAVDAARDLFREAWAKGGYAVVPMPGPDVMQVKTGVLNISVTAPDITGGRTHSFAREAGRATFFVEVRDSLTGTLLGRAVDQRVVGDDLNTWRTKGSNRADFRRQIERWAEISVRGMAEIKARGRRNS